MNINLNENEKAVLAAIQEILEEDTYFAEADDISDRLDMTDRQLAGYLSDLQRKGVAGQIDPGQWEVYL